MHTRRQRRLKKLRELLVAARLDALYITNPKNRFYLSGFSGSDGALLVSGNNVFLLTDFRYVEQAQAESTGCEIIETKNNYAAVLAPLLQANNITRLGCEGDHLVYRRFLDLRDKLADIELTATSGLVEKIRVTKDAYEIEQIGKAAQLADRAYALVLPAIKPGVSEREIALQLEYSMRRLGADGSAFPIIVASGPRSALPHGVASARRLQEGDLVTMDFGAVYHGYHSDITRTVVLGKPHPKQQEIYAIVLEAQLRALKAVAQGVRASDVDRAARELITGKGYGAQFGHGTGHGLGLQIHEDPRLSQNDHTVLQQGMTVTVEPGIYIPGWGGVRIEDTVVVSDTGSKILTGTPKEKLLNLINIT